VHASSGAKRRLAEDAAPRVRAIMCPGASMTAMWRVPSAASGRSLPRRRTAGGARPAARAHRGHQLRAPAGRAGLSSFREGHRRHFAVVPLAIGKVELQALRHRVDVAAGVVAHGTPRRAWPELPSACIMHGPLRPLPPGRGKSRAPRRVETAARVAARRRRGRPARLGRRTPPEDVADPACSTQPDISLRTAALAHPARTR